MGRAVVLMYHAVPTGSSQLTVGADQHYSVSMEDFRLQLETIGAVSGRARSVRDLLVPGSDSGQTAVALTFDDGHVTNFQAAQVIAEAGGSADFFINPTTVGSPGFLTWVQLREMSRWKMSIQSHSLNHVFLDELPPQEVWKELSESKQRIEAELGTLVSVFAPPNGRMPLGFMRTAQDAGYEAVCSSRAGLWDSGDASKDIPRLMMQHQTSLPTLAGWIEMKRGSILKQRLRYSALAAAKRALGNERYVRFRRVLLGSKA